MMLDLEERERATFAPDPTSKVRDEEKIARKLKEEIARICAMHANEAVSTTATSTLRKETLLGRKEGMDSAGRGLDKEKVLKVSWEKVGWDYNAQRLRELFETFGVVEDVLIRTSKKKGFVFVAYTTMFKLLPLRKRLGISQVLY